jgi:hypothetical protein
MEKDKEIWFELFSFEDRYLINIKGDVKTKGTTSIKTGRKPSGNILKKVISNSGYYTTALRREEQNQKNFLVHRLIAIQFIPNPENKPCVNHKDSNRLNNDISNLEWCTHSENNSHAHKSGGQKKYIGEKHSQSILTENDVLEIRRDYSKRINTMPMLANKYNVTRGAIQGVLLRKSWKHILEEDKIFLTKRVMDANKLITG